MTHDSPHIVQKTLADIEADLAKRANDYSDAARDRAKFTRDWEKRLAIHQRTAKGANADTRKANALSAAIEQDDLFEDLKDAEARFEALRVVTKVMETRAMIGMAILRSQGRA